MTIKLELFLDVSSHLNAAFAKAFLIVRIAEPSTDIIKFNLNEKIVAGKHD